MSGRRPAIKGDVWFGNGRGRGHVSGLCAWGLATGPDVCPLICWPHSVYRALKRRQHLGLGRLYPVVSHHLMVTRDYRTLLLASLSAFSPARFGC